MFERYTEKARCVLFYANFEARQFRQSEISTEHLLLALFREDRRLLETLVPGLTAEWTREEIENRVPLGKARFRSKDVPLSATGKRALAYATEEAGRLGHKYIDFEHLLFALAREKDTLAAQILRDHGFDLAKARVEFAQIAPRQRDANQWIRLVTQPEVQAWVVHFHWEKRRCEPQDALRNLADRRVALYHGEPYDASQFELVRAGWVHYGCAICTENVYKAGDPAGSTAYSNGRDWLCAPCYERFAAPADED